MPVLSKLQKQLRDHWYEQSQYGEKEINFFDTHAMQNASAKNKRFYKPSRTAQKHTSSVFHKIGQVAKHSAFRAIHDLHRAYVGTQNWLTRRNQPDADFQAVQRTKPGQNIDNTKMPLRPRHRTLTSRMHQYVYNHKREYHNYIRQTYDARRKKHANTQRTPNNALEPLMPQFSTSRMRQGAYMYFNEVFPTALTDRRSGFRLKRIWQRTFKPTLNDEGTLLKARSSIANYKDLKNNISGGRKYLTSHNLYAPTFKGLIKNEKNQLHNKEFQNSTQPNSEAAKQINNSYSDFNQNSKDYSAAQKDFVASAKVRKYSSAAAKYNSSVMSHPLTNSASSVTQSNSSNMSAQSSSIDSQISMGTRHLYNGIISRGRSSIASGNSQAAKPNNVSSSTSTANVNKASLVRSAMIQKKALARKHKAAVAHKTTSAKSQPVNVANSKVSAAQSKADAKVSMANSRAMIYKNTLSKLTNETAQLKKTVQSLQAAVKSPQSAVQTNNQPSNSVPQSSAAQHSSVASNSVSNSSTVKSTASVSSTNKSVANSSAAKASGTRIFNRMGRDDLKNAYKGLSKNATAQRRVVKYFINHQGSKPLAQLQKKLKFSKSTIKALQKKGVLSVANASNQVKANEEQNPALGQSEQQPPKDANKISNQRHAQSTQSQSKGIQSYDDIPKSDKHNYNVVMSDYRTRTWLKNKILPKQNGAKSDKTKQSIKNYDKQISKNFKALSNGSRQYVKRLHTKPKSFRYAAFEAHKRRLSAKNSYKNKNSRRHTPKKAKINTSYMKNIPKKDRYHYSKAISSLGAVRYFKTKRGMSKKSKVSGVSRNNRILKKQLGSLTQTSLKQFNYVKSHPSYLAKIGKTAHKYYKQRDYHREHSHQKAQSTSHKMSNSQKHSHSTKHASIPDLDGALNKTMKSRQKSKASDNKQNQKNQKQTSQSKHSQAAARKAAVRAKNSQKQGPSSKGQDLQ